MLYTTFQLAKQAKACTESYRKYAEHVGGVRKYGTSTPIPLIDLLEVCGVNDTLWVLSHCTKPDKAAIKILQVFACDCAEHVLPIYAAAHPTDNRLRNCLVVIRRFLDGVATFQELKDATRDAARDAWDGDAAWDAAAAAGNAAMYAWDAAWAAGDVVIYAWAATRDAARDAWDGDAAWDAAAAAGNAEREWQVGQLRELLLSS